MGKRKLESTNMINERHLDECDLSYALRKLGGRWKILILGKLENKTLRFKELKERVGNITERMLILQLKELEADGLVTRTAHPVVPPRVDYELTQLAIDSIPIWRLLEVWGAQHRNETGNSLPYPKEVGSCD
ncbi:transcriptional regulator [Chryseobacterium artocarpi]|uniref:Transcriptional regulator n=1 Tax=Chryseobacterium artocarpi TaxID=1414727 RepID=A0A1B8ZBW1_9FLAO|nr:helix-turn-helix domain-containing protein [Chryseobacterium artocarpi]OCA69093.1 transcriptional regulator [Chryseobacterium artocarpi]